MSYTPSRNSSGSSAKRMMQSPSLPMLPGVRQYTPKRKSFGRQALFQCGEGGVMLEKLRPASSPSRQQQSGASPIPRSPALLRPSSALGTLLTQLCRIRNSWTLLFVGTLRHLKVLLHEDVIFMIRALGEMFIWTLIQISTICIKILIVVSKN